VSVSDRWHKSRPQPGEPTCSEHKKVPTADHGEGDQWQVRWRDETGTQRKQNLAKKAAATSFDAEIRSRLDRGTSLDLAAGRQLVSEYGAKYRESLAGADSTAERLDRVVAPLAELSRSRLKALILAGALAIDGRTIRDPGHRVNAGDTIELAITKSFPRP